MVDEQDRGTDKTKDAWVTRTMDDWELGYHPVLSPCPVQQHPDNG